MRILQIVHGFPPREGAGTELVTLNLSKALRERGHQVTVFTRTADPEAQEFSVQEDQVEGLSVVRVVNNYTALPGFHALYASPFFDSVFLRLLNQVQPDVLHFQHVQHLSTRLLSLAAALGYRTVLTLHDFFFPCHLVNLINTEGALCAGPARGEQCVSCLRDRATPEEARQRFLHMERTLRAPDMILTPSPFLAQKIADFFPSLQHKLRVASLGVTTIPRIAKLQTPDAPLRILYVGVFLPHKGAHVLVEALKSLPSETFEAVLYGATVSTQQSYMQRLRKEAEGLPIRFFDGYPHEHLNSILAQCDVLVMPMIWEETFSLVTREALMAGLPVIAARRGALPEVVHDEVNGLLFDPENPEDLRRCLQRLIAEPDLVSRLSEHETPMKTVVEYAEEMESLYKEIVLPYRLQSQTGTSERAFSLTTRTEGGTTTDADPYVRVSVCMPTYNGGEFLAEALQSVLAQSFTDFELIIVDDQSSDTTLEIAHAFSDPRVRIYQNERRLGIPANWNRCLSLARGEYVCIFHQDDVMLPQNLEKKVHALAADPAIGFVHSAIEPAVEDSAPTPLADWIEKATEDFVIDGRLYFRKLLLHGECICAPAVMVRRQPLLELGGFDEELGYACDYEMWMKLCVEHKVAFLSQPLIRYRWHGRNASHGYRFERGAEECLTAARRALRYYRERTSESEEGEILTEALTAIGGLRRWAAELDKGRAWVEGQGQNWRGLADKRVRVIQQQKAWIEELERGKAWLEEQRQNWQEVAAKQERLIAEQQAWIDELKKGNTWLEEQGKSWRAEAEHRQTVIAQLRRQWIPQPLKTMGKFLYTKVSKALFPIAPALSSSEVISEAELSVWRDSQQYELAFWSTQWRPELVKAGGAAVVAHRLEVGRWFLREMDIPFDPSTLESPVFRGEVLEVGCGPVGFFETWPGVQVVACDPLMAKYAELLSCSILGSRANYLYSDSPIQTLSHAFDFVVCSNVLDHVENWRFVSHHMVRLCKPGGSILLFTDCRGRSVKGHRQLFSPDEVSTFFQALGCKIVLCRSVPVGEETQLFLKAAKETSP